KKRVDGIVFPVRESIGGGQVHVGPCLLFHPPRSDSKVRCCCFDGLQVGRIGIRVMQRLTRGHAAITDQVRQHHDLGLRPPFGAERRRHSSRNRNSISRLEVVQPPPPV